MKRVDKIIWIFMLKLVSDCEGFYINSAGEKSLIPS
jgi:hypothetical protein